MKFISFTILLSCILSSCNLRNESPDANKEQIVKVSDYVLYRSDLSELVGEGLDAKDSSQIVNAFINRWVRDKVTLLKARSQVLDSEGVQELVEEYRNTLILHNYEEKLVRSMLDTVVSEDSIHSYYKAHGRDLVLNEDVFLVSMFESGQSLREEKNFIEALEDSSIENETEVDTLINRQWMPKFRLEYVLKPYKLKYSIKELLKATENGRYNYFYIHESKDSGEAAPFEYVRDQIEKLILHNRKTKLLKQIKDQNYRQALKLKEVKFFQ